MPKITKKQLVDFAQVADGRLDALEANADKSLELALDPAGWTEDGENETYPLRYGLTVEGVTEASRADAVLDEAGAEAAEACSLRAFSDTAADTVVFRCQTAPDAPVTGTLYIKKNAVLTAADES